MNHYEELKKDYIKGWNTWNTRSVMSHVLMPEGFGINLCLKDYKSPAYLKEAFIGQREDNQEKIFPGPHAHDGSYTELNLKWRGIEIIVQTATQGEDIVMLVTPVELPMLPPALVVETCMLWNKPGTIVNQGEVINAALPSRTVTVYTTEPEFGEFNIPVQAPYKSMRLTGKTGISTGKNRTIQEIEKIIFQNKNSHLKRTKSFGELSEAYNAMQTCLAWDTIYEPSKDRVVSTVSRRWNIGWSGYVLFCWDNYFAAYMAALDNKEIAYSNVIEITREKTEKGFVPNFAAANGAKSRDRSQPPVGSMVVRELYRKYRDKWLLEELFEDLYGWNTWYFNNRQIEEGLLAWGSDPYEPVIGHKSEQGGNGNRQGAAYESGLDNSPMYDDIPFNTEKHMLELADAGLTGLYIMDCNALADIAEVIGKSREALELRERALSCSKGLKTLWDEQSGMFLNRRTDTGEFSERISPTNFYSLLSEEVTEAQTRRMMEEYFYNPEEFWGEYIMPSISRKDPAYPEQHYWRGRIWAPMNFLVYLGLRNHKLTNACKDMAEKSVKLILKEWLEMGHVHENYCADTGIGCNKANSDAFYHWGGLLSLIALIEAGFMEGWEKKL